MLPLADRDLMDQFTSFNFIDVDIRLVFIFLEHAHHMLRVVRDDARDHDEGSAHCHGLHQLLKSVAIRLEF